MAGERVERSSAGEEPMAFYLVQVAYKDIAAKTLIANPQTREDVIKKTCKSLGGKLQSFFFSLGDYDVTIIAELPSNTAAAALALATSSKGAISKYHTTALLTAAEGVEAMTLAQKVDYAPPK
jgi:uncharacterized protein with GYD domain